MANKREVLTIAVAVIIGLFAFTSPIPQDPAYHLFVDTREIFGVSNFWNVASNLPFLLVGIAGIGIVYRFADAVCVDGQAASLSRVLCRNRTDVLWLSLLPSVTQ